MKTGVGNGDIAPSFLMWAIDAGEWSASGPDHLNPWGNSPDTNWIEGWVVPRVNLDTFRKRKRY
jgi:hypothetical protein